MENNRVRIFDKLPLDHLWQHFSVSASLVSSLQPNQNLACFLMFLLQVLDDEAPSFSNDSRKGLYALLQKEVTFLHALLGDELFQWTNIQDTINLLNEFETIANEMGSFIYSVVSATSQKMRKSKFDAGIKALFDKVEMFANEKVKVHCIKELPQASRPNHLSSLFIIGSLVEDLQGLLDGQFNLNIDGIKDQINTLITELTFFLPLLKDIEKSQVAHTNGEMQESVIHFIDVTYEAEYLINTHTAGQIPSWYLNLRLPIIVQKIHIAGKRIQEIRKVDSVQETKIEALRYPVEDASNVVGFEDIRERILADLLGGSTNLQIISVIGMSGIGKTTIAKKLFNDRAVRDYFHLQVWCTISQIYDKKKLLDEIWMNLTRKSEKEGSLELRIYQTLFGRKYLIIMDDVWDSFVWDDLRSCFPNNGNGSRIMFTSQIKHCAPHGIIFHPVPLLSNDECYNLLTKKVSVTPELVDVAKRIASNCHGLPLMVVVVAGILSNLGDRSVWKNVQVNLESYVSAHDSSMSALELSYDYLPSHLKPCFLTLAWIIASKDIQIRDVIRRWISHGFVQKEEHKSQEDIAYEYLLELINRSLLSIAKRRSDGGVKVCEFHDLIYDMCYRTAKTKKFFNGFMTQYSSFVYGEHPHFYLEVAPRYISSLSSLHCRSITNRQSAFGCSIIQMPLLRVYDNTESRIDEKTVSGLVQLRYLRYAARIAQIPEGISKLVNLEYLILYHCDIVDVPSSILKMVKLKHIEIAKQVIFLRNCDISHIRNNVKSLSCVRIRNGDDEEILRCSPHLQKLKCICEGLIPDVSSLTLLESVNIRVSESPRRLKGELTQMKFPPRLKKVTLSGTNLPWEESSALGTLPNLEVLKLLYDAFCGKEWETRDDEFQELRYLKIHNILSLRQWTSCKEHFPKLQNLVLGHVRVEIPQDFGDIPTLKTIEVSNCGNKTNESAEVIREEQQEYENEDLKIIIRDTISSKLVLVEDEVSAPQKEQPNMDEASTSIPGNDICQSCNTKIYGKYRVWKGCYWHSECFCCRACKQRIYDAQFTELDGSPCHGSCWKELNHPKCVVCKDYVQGNADRKHACRRCKFWGYRYCRSHLTDGTPRCLSCGRFETILDVPYWILDDFRALCLECKEASIITNTEECHPLYMEIQDFFQSLNIKLKQEIQILLVDKQAMDEATKGRDYKSCLVCNVDGADNLTKVVNYKILVLSCFPRVLTGYHIAWQIILAWLSLEGYQDFRTKVHDGICDLSSHMWLEHEIVSGSSKKGQLSTFEKKLGDYYKDMIENDSSCRDGFWEAKRAVDKYGLKHTLDHICRTESVFNF